MGATLAKGTGEPVSLAEILLTPPAFISGVRGHLDAPEEESLVATSNEAGEFRFSGLAPGRYRIEARAPGYASAVLASAPIPFRGRVTLLMVPGGGLDGTVLGADGQPAAGAEVLAMSREQALSAFSDSEGHFSLEVPPGAYAISAQKGPEAGALEQEVKVTAGQRVQGLHLQFGAGAWLSGKVVRRDGSGVLGARVEASPRGVSAVGSQAGTDESGAFSFPALAAGTYTLQVFLPERVFLPVGAQFSHGPITLAASEHVSLTLTANDGPGGSVACWVQDESKHPVRGVQLRVSPLQAQGATDTRAIEGRTDATGKFVFTGLPPGMFRVEALRDGHSLSGALSLFVEKNSSTSCSFLVPSETAPEDSMSMVEGRVLQRSGAPPDEPVLVEFHYQDKPGPYLGRVLVDTQGRFRLAVSPGPYTLKAFRERSIGCGAAGQRELQVEAGQHLETTLLLEETREPDLRLRVLEANGTPAKLTPVRVHTLASFSELAQTDEQARLDVCLPPVEQQPPTAPLLIVSSFDGARAAKVEAASGLGELTLQLRPLPFVQGRIIHPYGIPVGHLILDISSASMRVPTRAYEFVGDRFELPEFPLGPTQLVVTANGLRASLSLNLQPEERKELELPVYPGVAMTGRLVDVTTRQPVRAWVVAPLRGGYLTGEDGRFSFQDLPAGEFFLNFRRTHISSPGESLPAPQLVRLSPEQDNDVGDIAVHVP